LITITLLTSDPRELLIHQSCCFAPIARRRLIDDANPPEVFDPVNATIVAAQGKVIVFLDYRPDGDHVYATSRAYSRQETSIGIPIEPDTTFVDMLNTSQVVPNKKFPDAKHSNSRGTLRRFISGFKDFQVVPYCITTGFGNLPASAIRKEVLTMCVNPA
jgi:hypothetical protein